jgi:16S rRNA (cytosine967-C5)-methyltransferase
MQNGEPFDLEKREDYVSQIDARSKIVDILTRVETKQSYSDKLLQNEIGDLEDADRRFVTEVVNGVLRWRQRLDWYLNQLYMGEYDNLIPEVKNNLRSSVYQLVYLDKIPPYAVLFEAVEIAKKKYKQKTANLVNAILRNFLRQHRKFDMLETQLEILDKLSIKYSHPRWLIQRWIEYWGIDEVILLCQANNGRPPIYVRMDKNRSENETLFRSLDEKNIEYAVHDEFSNFLRIDNFQAFRNLDFLENGWVYVQDISTGFPVWILDPQPDETILDMCAAPGGKTGYMAERMNGTGIILALDRHSARVKLVRENVSRYGYRNIFIAAADGLALPTAVKFDKILIDAPCSGLGVLNKRADLKWKRTEQDIQNMKKLQLELLDSASQIIRPGGLIVYSTCTVEPEENEGVVREFMSKNSGFEFEKLSGKLPEKYISEHFFIRTFPHKHDMDGSFAVGLRAK